MNDLDPALAARLAMLAARGQTVTYGALARELGWRVSVLTDALEAMMEQDAAQGRPLRAVMLEARLSGGLPARGFFEKAAALGFDTSDPARFAADHRMRLWRDQSL